MGRRDSVSSTSSTDSWSLINNQTVGEVVGSETSEDGDFVDDSVDEDSDAELEVAQDALAAEDSDSDVLPEMVHHVVTDSENEEENDEFSIVTSSEGLEGSARHFVDPCNVSEALDKLVDSGAQEDEDVCQTYGVSVAVMLLGVVLLGHFGAVLVSQYIVSVEKDRISTGLQRQSPFFLSNDDVLWTTNIEQLKCDVASNSMLPLPSFDNFTVTPTVVKATRPSELRWRKPCERDSQIISISNFTSFVCTKAQAPKFNSKMNMTIGNNHLGRPVVSIKPPVVAKPLRPQHHLPRMNMSFREAPRNVMRSCSKRHRFTAPTGKMPVMARNHVLRSPKPTIPKSDRQLATKFCSKRHRFTAPTGKMPIMAGNHVRSPKPTIPKSDRHLATTRVSPFNSRRTEQKYDFANIIESDLERLLHRLRYDVKHHRVASKKASQLMRNNSQSTANQCDRREMLQRRTNRKEKRIAYKQPLPCRPNYKKDFALMRRKSSELSYKTVDATNESSKSKRDRLRKAIKAARRQEVKKLLTQKATEKKLKAEKKANWFLERAKLRATNRKF